MIWWSDAFKSWRLAKGIHVISWLQVIPTTEDRKKKQEIWETLLGKWKGCRTSLSCCAELQLLSQLLVITVWRWEASCPNSVLRLQCVCEDVLGDGIEAPCSCPLCLSLIKFVPETEVLCAIWKTTCPSHVASHGSICAMFDCFAFWNVLCKYFIFCWLRCLSRPLVAEITGILSKWFPARPVWARPWRVESNDCSFASADRM